MRIEFGVSYKSNRCCARRFNQCAENVVGVRIITYQRVRGVTRMIQGGIYLNSPPDQGGLV